MTESFRQALGAVYVALAEAAGGDDVLNRANDILQDAVDAGAIGDPYACDVIERLVRNTSLDVCEAAPLYGSELVS